MVTIAAEPLTAEAFAPFGTVLRAPSRDADASGPGWRWWAETSLLAGDGRPWSVGWLGLRPTDLRFDWAERHLRSPEAIVATGEDLLVYVGPPDHPEEPERLTALQRFRAFRVPAGAGVLMDPGVWHGAPFTARGATPAMVLLLEGTASRDVTVVRFEDAPVEIGG